MEVCIFSSAWIFFLGSQSKEWTDGFKRVFLCAKVCMNVCAHGAIRSVLIFDVVDI